MKKLFILMGLLPLYLPAMQHVSSKKTIFVGRDYGVLNNTYFDPKTYVNKTVFNPNAYINYVYSERLEPIRKSGVLPLVRDKTGQLHAILFLVNGHDQNAPLVYTTLLQRKQHDHQHAVAMASQRLDILDPKIFDSAKVETAIFETGCELAGDGLINGGIGSMIYVAEFKKTTAEDVGVLCKDAQQRLNAAKIIGRIIKQVDVVPFNTILGAVEAAQEVSERDNSFINTPVEVEGYGHVSVKLARAMARRLDRLKALQ